MNICALFQAAKVEAASAPYDTLHVKVFYPAQLPGNEQAQVLGMVPVDPKHAPFKIIILFNGINCGPEGYQWLAVRLAKRGYVVMTFAWIAENLPGMIALTPGVDLSLSAPNTYGSGPTASALPTLLTVLAQLQAQGILAGLLDLQQVILGGHSAGGRIAIESASPQFYPQVVAAFAYGAHTAGLLQLGYPAGTILPLPDVRPLLLIGGTCDGVIAHSGYRYGVTWEQPTTPLLRTFREAIAGGRNESYLLLLARANHFLMTYPLDTTTASVSLDLPATQPEAPLRDLLADTIGLFLDAHVGHQTAALTALNQYAAVSNPLIALFENK